MPNNIILVTIDSLRADHCGFINQQATTTPYLDELAEDGLIFENAIAPGPRTPSSMPPTLTGEFYDYEGISLDDVSERRQLIARHLSRHTSLAKRFQEKGYSTAAVTANPWTAPNTTFDDGFDVFHETGGNGADRLDSLRQFPVLRTIDEVLGRTGNEELFGWHRKREWFSHWSGFYETIREGLAELDEPFFAWIFLLDPHQPYIVPKAFREEISAPEMYYSIYRFWNERRREMPRHVETRLRRAYRDAVRSADGFVERLDHDLVDGSTALVVHSDYGEGLGDHGVYGHEYHLYEENIHVPLLVANGNVAGRVEKPISLVELPDIVLGAVDPNRESPSGSNYVVSQVESREVASEQAKRINYAPHDIAVRTSDWKYIQTPAGDELYHLAEDPRERENVIDEHGEKGEILRGAIERHRDERAEKGSIDEASERLSHRKRVIL
jgi:arylsulfatase A-like enzyme